MSLFQIPSKTELEVKMGTTLYTMAELGWIDFSKKDRNRVNSILDLLRPEGQVDELGIGTLRDGLANRLFPGISTIQTRSKYFFIIPYILWDYLKLPLKDRKKKKPTQYLEEQEYEVMWNLADEYNHEEGHGVIGITKRRDLQEKIARRPSEIYWNGLNVMKCIDSRGLSANSFLNRAHRINAETLERKTTKEGQDDDQDVEFENYFNIKVPYNTNWRNGLRLDLSAGEAAFLNDNFIDLKDTVLALVMHEEGVYDFFSTSTNFIDFAKLCLNYPMSAQLKSDLILAHDFSILMEGAHIAYNQELQKQFCGEDNFDSDWTAYYKKLNHEMININGFLVEELFRYAPTTRLRTKHFISEWVKLMQSEILDLDKKKQLIHDQEYYAKGKKARLKFNRKDDIEFGNRIGLRRLEYRYFNAKTIVEDIKKGLQNA